MLSGQWSVASGQQEKNCPLATDHWPLAFHRLQNGRDHHLATAVGRAPRLLQKIAVELFVPHEEVGNLVENGAVFERSEQMRERLAVRQFVEREHRRLLHV